MVKRWAIGLMILCTVFTSIAQVFYKIGSGSITWTSFLNWQIALGVFLYLIGAGLMITSLRGGDVSTLYPIAATSYVWVLILSALLFNEAINISKVAGISGIIIGLFFIGRGA